jgi:hypothetical protein
MCAFRVHSLYIGVSRAFVKQIRKSLFLLVFFIFDMDHIAVLSSGGRVGWPDI